MAGMTKRRWTYVITAIVAAGIVILAVILMQQPIPTSNTPPVRTPPAVSTVAATGVDQSTATLNGDLTGLGSAATVTVGFRYGTSSSLAGATNVTTVTLIATSSFTEGLTGLSPGTTYYFGAWANGEGFRAGSVLSFTTLTQPVPEVRAPSVSTKAATAVGNSTATLNGDLADLGTASTVSVGFVYGTDAHLASAANLSFGTESAAGAFSLTVKNLNSNTTYFVQAWALGNGFASGSVVSFNTTAVPSGGGNGNQVPPGWAHARCPTLPPQAVGHGVKARCEHNETYGQMKKDGLHDLAQYLASLPPAAPKGASTAAVRVADPGNSGEHRSENSRQW